MPVLRDQVVTLPNWPLFPLLRDLLLDLLRDLSFALVAAHALAREGFLWDLELTPRPTAWCAQGSPWHKPCFVHWARLVLVPWPATIVDALLAEVVISLLVWRRPLLQAALANFSAQLMICKPHQAGMNAGGRDTKKG